MNVELMKECLAEVIRQTTSISGARSTGYTEVVTHWSAHTGTALTVAMALLVVAVLGKSAQFPFQDWLADAMAGPTPASALIHAATMVAAGAYILVRLFPLYAASTVTLTVVPSPASSASW